MDLTQRTGVIAGFLCQLERGIATPLVDCLERVADALSLPLGYFFKDFVQTELAKRQRTKLSLVVHEGRSKILSSNKGVALSNGGTAMVWLAWSAFVHRRES